MEATGDLEQAKRMEAVSPKKQETVNKFEYFKNYEHDPPVPKNAFFAIRVDGVQFAKFCKANEYAKPNDLKGLKLMTSAAVTVTRSLADILFAYGHSDEYSFIFKRSTSVWGRRQSKLLSAVASLFTAKFISDFKSCFGREIHGVLPYFDARIIVLPTLEDVINYIRYRQIDCHVNNLYNTCLWALIQESKLTAQAATERLKGTVSSDKNELLFKDYGINYNNLPEIYRKGSLVVRRPKKKKSPKAVAEVDKKEDMEDDVVVLNGAPKSHNEVKTEIKEPTPTVPGHSEGAAAEAPGAFKGVIIYHEDLVADDFWRSRPELFGSTPPVPVEGISVLELSN